MQKKNTNRMQKVDEEFKRELGKIIDQDLKSARVYISILGSKSKKNTLEGIKNASGFIRTELAKNVNLRYTPELIFEVDESMEYGAKIDKILQDLKNEDNNIKN